MTDEEFRTFISTLSYDDKLDLARSFFSAAELTVPSPHKEKNKRLYKELVAYLELDLELLADKEGEWAADLQRIRSFLEDLVAKAA